MKAQDIESRYWRSAAQPAAAVACTLIILIIIFLVLVLTPHQCGPEDEAILVEGPVEVVVRDTACTAGQGRDQGSVCVPCPLGTFNNGSFTFCQSCPIGFFADVEGSTQCTPCAPGIGLTTPDVGYPNGDCTCQRDYSSYAIPNGTCVTAPDTAKCLCRETDAGRQTTLDEYCDDGSDNSGCICLLSGEDDLWLVGDPSGNTRWRERGCIQCPRGKYKDTPSWDACLECSDPRIPSRMEVNGACICAPGYFKADDGGCPACPIGSYKRLASDEGSVACITCPPGTTTATAGTITLGECQCSQGFEGFFLQRGDGSSQLELQCRPCPPGYFKDTLGPQECQPCAPGTHAPTNATVQCRVCSPGEIAPAIGSQFCTLCLPGSYSPDPGGTVCEECIEDTFNLEYGASRCTQCLPNTFAAQGSARCSDCWQNYLGRSGVYLSRKGDTNLGYSVIPTMFLIIIALAFIFCLLLAYEAYRYLTGKRPPDGFVGDGEFRNIGVADIVPGGGAGMQPLVVPYQQPHPLQTLMQMSREQLYSVQKVEQEELGKDQARIRGNLEAMQQEAQAQLAQQPGATAEAQDELRLVHQTQTRQLEAFQALQMRSLQERHLKEQEHQMRAQQDQLDQQYHVQQREWEAYQSQRQADQQQQWDEFQRQIQLNQQQMAAVQPTNHQEPPAYYYPPGQAPLPPAPSMPRPQPPATLPAPPVMPGAQPAPVPGAGALYGSQVGMPAPPMPPNPYGSQVGMPAPPMPPNPYGSQVGMAPAPGMPMPMPQPLYGSQIGVPPGAMQGPVGFQPSAPSVQGSVYGPAPSAFSQPTPPPPVPMPPTQQAPPPQPPQTGPTDEHWQQILRQVDNM